MCYILCAASVTVFTASAATLFTSSGTLARLASLSTISWWGFSYSTFTTSSTSTSICQKKRLILARADDEYAVHIYIQHIIRILSTLYPCVIRLVNGYGGYIKIFTFRVTLLLWLGLGLSQGSAGLGFRSTLYQLHLCCCELRCRTSSTALLYLNWRCC